MPARDIVVIGASAGGVEALINLTRALPYDLPAALVIVVHFPTESTSILPHILNRKSKIPAVHAKDEQVVEPGNIYVAPPDHHLHLEDGRLRLYHGPRENGFRPAIDPLFRSAARAYGQRVVGVILSGTLGDGALGLKAIKRAGGIAIVQDPQEAVFSSMPLNAIETAEVDLIVPLSGIAEALSKLSTQQGREEGVGSVEIEDEKDDQRRVQSDMARFEEGKQPEANTVLTCPECGGVLWELENGELAHYECHVGHSYSQESLLHHQGAALEAALWTAVRSLEERAALVRRLAASSSDRGNKRMEARFMKQAQEAEHNAHLIRQLLLRDHMNFSSSSSPMSGESGHRQHRAGTPPVG